jgi:hypothetical protein
VVVTDCQEFLDAFDGRVQHASQNFPPTRSHRLEVWRNERGYSLKEDGRQLDSQSDAEAAAEAVHWRMQDLSLAALPEFTKIHAGCASWQGKRFLMAGPTRAGKTTLMTRMLYEGFAVYCDDIVLLRRGEVLPYPRRLWIRANAVRLLPQIVPFAIRSRKIRNHFSIDLTELGFEWRIYEAPVDAVFFLEANHGSDTRLEEYPKYAMAQRIMSQSNLPASGAQEWIKDVVAMLDTASSFLLHCGSLDSAIRAVKSVLGANVIRAR